MLTLPVPDYFQKESEPALRSQVNWLEEEVGLTDCFFARVLRMDATTFSEWRNCLTSLSSEQEDDLRDLWQTFLHLLSFLNFDRNRTQQLLEHTSPDVASSETSPLSPPWRGSSLKEYLEQQGTEGLVCVDRWVTSFRFGDPYESQPERT